MIKLALNFIGSSGGATSIEYAIMGSGIALVIVTTVSVAGANLAASYAKIASALP